MKTRITINGREVDRPEAMSPEVRRAVEDAMRRMGPALEGAGGIPDEVEGTTGSGPRDGLVVENQIVVNGQTFRGPDDMPPDVRRLYDDAMAQVRRGSGITVTRAWPTFSIGFERRGRSASPGVTAGARRPVEPTAIESRLRNAVVVLAILVIGGLAAWVLEVLLWSPAD